jgi:GNAT superfamily N-acetyltransferase
MSTMIRRAELADLDLVVPLFEQYRAFYRQPPDQAKVRAFLTDRLRNRDSVIFLAFVDGTATGLMQLYPIFSSISIGRALVLNDLFVDSDARGLGVGRALIDRAVHFGRETGARYLELATEITNSSAQGLYDRAGWVRDRDFYHYSFDLA